jgi:hypothetical protein
MGEMRSGRTLSIVHTGRRDRLDVGARTSRGRLSSALHKIKEGADIPPYGNTRIDAEGNVYDEETGEVVGNIIDEAHG